LITLPLCALADSLFAAYFLEAMNGYVITIGRDALGNEDFWRVRDAAHEAESGT